MSGPKSSVYQKLPVEDADGLKDLLSKMQGVHTIVEKKREIYLYENVRIHLDDVKNLGSFLEFEAVLDEKFNNREEETRKVEFLMEILQIMDDHLINESYENLITKNQD
jgi:predicted adenylyl cyclase CyaB